MKALEEVKELRQASQNEAIAHRQAQNSLKNEMAAWEDKNRQLREEAEDHLRVTKKELSKAHAVGLLLLSHYHQ